MPTDVFTTKRIYETANAADGLRVLVDRIWPRGIARNKAAIDLWVKDVAPSHDLRTWFRHQEHLWPEFETRYRDELIGDGAAPHVKGLLRLAGKHDRVTLLYSARDIRHNQAVALSNFLNERMSHEA